MKNHNDSDIIYFNAIISNNTNQAVPSNFDQTRTNVILNNPSDYYMAVSRFSISTRVVPLFIPQIIDNPNDPNDRNFTPYQVWFVYNGIEYRKNLRFIPGNTSPYPQITGEANPNSYYYFIYDYVTLVTMINNALQEAFDDLLLSVPGLQAECPYFILNGPEVNTMSLITQNIENNLVPGQNIFLTPFYTKNDINVNVNDIGKPKLNVPGCIYIHMNSILYTYIGSLSTYFIFRENNQYRHDVLITIKDLKNNYYYPPQNEIALQDQTPIGFSNGGIDYTFRPLYFITSQEFPTDSRIKQTSLASLVFLTSALPIQPEYLPNNSDYSLSSSGVSTFSPILADFMPDLDVVKDIGGQLVYNPAQFRYISLNSTEPLRRIDIQIMWRDNKGVLRDLILAPNCSQSIKLMFIKKSLVKNYI